MCCNANTVHMWVFANTLDALTHLILTDFVTLADFIGIHQIECRHISTVIVIYWRGNSIFKLHFKTVSDHNARFPSVFLEGWIWPCWGLHGVSRWATVSVFQFVLCVSLWENATLNVIVLYLWTRSFGLPGKAHSCVCASEGSGGARLCLGGPGACTLPLCSDRSRQHRYELPRDWSCHGGVNGWQSELA